MIDIFFSPFVLSCVAFIYNILHILELIYIDI